MDRAENDKNEPLPSISADGEPLPNTTIFPPGTQINRFSIERTLGKGGMGIVYLGRDNKLERQVAIKCIPKNLKTAPNTWQRLQREAKLLAQLNHRNIATLYEQIDEPDGHTYLILEYVPGQSLATLLNTSQLTQETTMAFSHQIAAGLSAAHEQGVIHRDLKPSNIMCTPDKTLKILDFGLAKRLDSLPHQHMTMPGSVFGTVSYMSPEQVRGEAVDARSDLWSFGVILYQLFTGTLPFTGKNPQQTMQAIQHTSPVYPTNIKSQIPGPWESFILNLLEKDKEDRPQTIQDVIKNMPKQKQSTSVSIDYSHAESPSIAVLPFVNMSSDTEQDFFCDGIAEELINALTQFQDVRVIARTSAFSFKGKQIPIRDIGRQLNVSTVLEGSVRKAGNRLRITAQLINTSQDHHIWSERYDREVGDVFEIQDDITATIISKLKPQLVSHEQNLQNQNRPAQLDAYTMYLKGRYFRAKGTPGALDTAFGYFKQAIDIDPNYALPYAGMALSYSLLPFYSPTPPHEAIPIAEGLLQKTLALDPNLSEALGCLGFIKAWYQWDWHAAEKAIKQAIQQTPGSERLHLWYAHYLMLRGQYDQALRAIDHALELDPISVVQNRDRGIILYCAGKHAQAIETLEKTIAMDPHIMYAHSHLGAAYVEQGEFDKAFTAYQTEKQIAQDCHTWAEMLEGLAYNKIGQPEKTREALNTLQTRAQHSYVAPFHLACLHFELNEDDQGFKAMESAQKAKDQWRSFYKAMPSYKRLSNDPRLKVIEEKA